MFKENTTVQVSTNFIDSPLANVTSPLLLDFYGRLLCEPFNIHHRLRRGSFLRRAFDWRFERRGAAPEQQRGKLPAERHFDAEDEMRFF